MIKTSVRFKYNFAKTNTCLYSLPLKYIALPYSRLLFAVLTIYAGKLTQEIIYEEYKTD